MKRRNYRRKNYIQISKQDTYQDKLSYVNHLHELIGNHLPDYDIYFMTVTFSETADNISYAAFKEFFFLMRKQLERNLRTHSKKLSQAKIILIPERNPELHFHGFLLIHKRVSTKFESNFVHKKNLEHIKKIDAERTSLKIKDKLLFSNYSQLSIYSYRFYQINSKSDIQQTSHYCGKKFPTSDFSLDDVIEETKLNN